MAVGFGLEEAVAFEGSGLEGAAAGLSGLSDLSDLSDLSEVAGTVGEASLSSAEEGLSGEESGEVISGARGSVAEGVGSGLGASKSSQWWSWNSGDKPPISSRSW